MNKNINEVLGKEWSDSLIENKEYKAKNLDEDEDNVNSGMWSIHGRMWRGVESTSATLAPGAYETETDFYGNPFLIKKDIMTDNLIKLPDDPTSEVLDHIEDFWAREERFRDLGFVFKRGILLWGPQGSGKTATLFQAMVQMINKGDVVFLCDYPSACKKNIHMLREIEPDRRVIVILEDVDDIIRHYGDRGLTHLLDGDASTDNVVFIATTNYPERLPPRLLQRPSRFDVVKFIGMPTANARRTYISHVLPNIGPSELDAIVRNTEDMSIAQIKEVIILTQIFDIEVNEASNRVRTMGRNLISETPGGIM